VTSRGIIAHRRTESGERARQNRRTHGLRPLTQNLSYTRETSVRSSYDAYDRTSDLDGALAVTGICASTLRTMRHRRPALVGVRALLMPGRRTNGENCTHGGRNLAPPFYERSQTLLVKASLAFPPAGLQVRQSHRRPRFVSRGTHLPALAVLADISQPPQLRRDAFS
jgi:hypothetical protein